MLNRILVIGGYGKVGRTVCSSLAGKFPGQIIAAGRNRQESEAFSASTDGKVQPLSLDIYSPDSIRALDPQTKLVVMCIDQQNPNFVQTCLRKGIHYIDVTADYPFVSQVQASHQIAKSAGSTAVLGVGLAPGLTSLLAQYSRSLFEQAQHADLFVLLGSGEAHGEAALDWTLKNMNYEFRENPQDRKSPAQSLSKKQTYFPGELGRRRAFPFNFLERHTLPHTLAIDSVDTWIAFDSDATTWGFMLSKKMGLSWLIDSPWGRRCILNLMKNVHIGSERYVVKIEMQGCIAGQPRGHEVSISGTGEGHATGITTAEVAERLMTGSYTPGVFYIEQLFELQDFLKKLRQRGLIFEFSESAPSMLLNPASC